MNIQIRGIIALLRLPYWMMSGGLALLTAFAITPPGTLDLKIVPLIFFSMAFVTSAGFSVNDYFDRESDAVIKPKRPIPAGSLSLKQVITVSIFFFALGLGLAALINPFSFGILLIDSVLLLLYSAFVKRKSGFAANVLVGLLVGTAFIYGGAAVILTVPISISISLTLYPICFGTIGGNVLRDILSLKGDSKIGYPTLPQRRGNKGAIRIAVFFFITTAILAPLPFVFQFFSVYYLFPILLWSALLCYASIRLLTSTPTVENVKKYERLITMSMIFLLLSLIIEALV